MQTPPAARIPRTTSSRMISSILLESSEDALLLTVGWVALGTVGASVGAEVGSPVGVLGTQLGSRSRQ